MQIKPSITFMRSVQILPRLNLALNVDGNVLKESDKVRKPNISVSQNFVLSHDGVTIERGFDWLTDLLHTYTTRYFTSQNNIGLIRSSQSVTLFTSRCLVAASNSERSPSSWFPIGPCSQLPASNSNSSQQLNSIGCPTNSRTHQPINWLPSQNCFATGGLRPIIRLGFKPFETHDQRSRSPFVTPSLMRCLVCRL
jgi:hypothetical protein